jgi:AcrR family transcriptional regulator
MRQRILEVARELFETKGFAATSLRDIAERLEVSKAALYYHFPRKSQLVHDVLVPMADDIDAWFERAEQGDLPVRRLLLDYFDAIYRHRGLIAAIGREPAAMDTADLVARLGSWLQRSQRLFVVADAPIEDRIRATFAIAGLARTTSFFAEDQVDALREVTVDAAMEVLAPLLAERPERSS